MTNEKEIDRNGTLFLENKEFLPLVIELTDKGHEVTLPVRGNSMRPFLSNTKDKAVLVKPSECLRIGDVVLAEVSYGHYVLHRIIRIDGDLIQMQGDGNLYPDPVIPSVNVKAIAKGFIRNGRNRIDYVDGLYFKTYSIVWMGLRPVRRWILAFFRKCNAVLRL